MSQSRSPTDTEERQSSQTSLSKESAANSPAADNLCPNLDDEVSAARGADLAIPQKREREVSLEAATPHPDDIKLETALRDHVSQSAVKKSRALSTPAEVDENDNDEEFADALESDAPTPSPQPSPPHETKTRQLSQGADDTGLRNGQSERQDNVDPVAPVEFDNAATPDTQPQIGTSSLTPAATIPKMQNQTDIAEISSPGGVAAKGTIEETAATTSVEHATAPSPADAVPTTTEQVLVRPTTSAKPIPQSEAQYTQKIDNQTSSVPVTEARADSNAVKRPTPPLSEADCATKRPREDGDQDPNPREAKRASPPPEKEKEKEKEKREKPARKKSLADSHAQSTLASPRATHASGFGGGGFLAYASVSSPFAAVKGPSVFGSAPTLTKSSTVVTTTPTPPTTSNVPTALTTTASLPNSPPKTAPNSPVQRAASPTPAKRTGFEAFASAASPFASAAARTRSPVRRSGSPGPGGGGRSNPFAVYATGGAQGLFGASGAPAAKRARGDSESIAPGENKGSNSPGEGGAETEKTFGERLRAGSGSGGDDEDETDGVLGVWGEQVTGGKWTEQEVLTGEEEDETIHSVRGKLFMLSEQNQWKERGSGLLRLNRRKADRGGARLVMRKDAVYAVLLNVTLFRGMSCGIAQDPRYLRFSVLTPGGTMHYNLRVGSTQAASDLLKAINDNIPHA